MEKKVFNYLRFKPSQSADKGLISELAKCPFDYIFTPTTSQEEVFNKFKYISDDLETGKNACMIVLGSSNSGKRYSLFGEFPAYTGIIIRIVEDLLHSEYANQYKIFFKITDIHGNFLIHSKTNTDNRIHIKVESSMIDIIQVVQNEKISEQTIVYKLILSNTSRNHESELTIIQMSDSFDNLKAFISFMYGYKIIINQLSNLIFSSTDIITKVSVLFTCKEEKKDVKKLISGFSLKDISDCKCEESTETLGNESENLKNRIVELENKLKTTNSKLFDAEKRAHEYYECYHKTLLLINKDSTQNAFLNSQNESLIRQIRKETSILQALESKFQALFETCTKSHESTYIEFDNCIDSLVKSESSLELNVTDTLNLGITQVKLSLIPDPQISPYSEELKQALEGNSELTKDIQILQLKNQLIEASVLNANLSRMVRSFDWKMAMIKHRYEMKRLITKQQQERIKSLEEMLEYLSNSFYRLKNNIPENDFGIEKLFEKHCFRAINDSQQLVSEYKKSMQTMEMKVSECYRKESKN